MSADALRRALAPQTESEHRVVEYLAIVAPSQVPLLVSMVQRRAVTARRAGAMHTAQLALAYLTPAPGSPPDVLARFEHVAAGGDEAPEVEQLDRDQVAGDERRGGGQR